MDIQLASGEARILRDGFATTFLGQDLVLEIRQASQGFAMRVVLSFTTDPAVEDVAVEVRDIDGGLQIHLTNFDTPDGRGSAMPVMLCKIESSVIFFHFQVFRFGKTREHSVQYTFFAVPESQVDLQIAPGESR